MFPKLPSCRDRRSIRRRLGHQAQGIYAADLDGLIAIFSPLTSRRWMPAPIAAPMNGPAT